MLRYRGGHKYVSHFIVEYSQIITVASVVFFHHSSATIYRQSRGHPVTNRHITRQNDRKTFENKILVEIAWSPELFRKCQIIYRKISGYNDQNP